MKLETFFNKFDELADTPDGVKKLRELVLRLATTGHLIPTDGSGWATATLNEIASARMGKTILKNELSDFGIPVYSAGRENAAWGFIASSDLTFRTGTIVVSARGTIGFPKIPAEPEFISTQTTIAITPTSQEIDSGYFCLQLQTVDWDDLTAKTAIPMITVKQVHAIEIRYPHSLAEQKRIVAKVDELMALCDRLEAQQQERETRHAALARASLARFADAPTPANLPFLFHPSYSIPPADLRKSILTLAVQGKLVPQDPNEEDVAHSLSRNDERRREASRTDHRADIENQPLLSADEQWEIADTWSWRGLADLVLFVDYRGKTPAKLSSGVRLLTAKNVRKGQINLSPEEFLSEDEYHDWMTRGFPKAGDVLFTTEAPMGNAAVVELKERFALAQRVICFQSYGAIDAGFLVMQILSDQFQFILDKNGTGVTAKGIKASKLKQLPIAVPPVAEQRRIVAKVDQLMALVDQLETQLAASRATAANLLSALVADLTTENRFERIVTLAA